MNAKINPSFTRHSGMICFASAALATAIVFVARDIYPTAIPTAVMALPAIASFVPMLNDRYKEGFAIVSGYTASMITMMAVSLN